MYDVYIRDTSKYYILRPSPHTHNITTPNPPQKNRREISGCGVAQYLDRIFVMGSPEAKAHMLRMIGNLLSSNLFHDRIAREGACVGLPGNAISLRPGRHIQAHQPPSLLDDSRYVLARLEVRLTCEVVLTSRHTNPPPRHALVNAEQPAGPKGALSSPYLAPL